MAFYKKVNNELFDGFGFVLTSEYELHEDLRETYDYPVDGWYWFDTEEEAKEFFGIQNE